MQEKLSECKQAYKQIAVPAVESKETNGGAMRNNATKTATILGGAYLRELEAEERATRECLENVPMEKFDWKPHDKSMPLGYLAVLVADIPRWIQHMIEFNVIDFATYEQFQANTSDELVAHFEEATKNACKALAAITEEVLNKEFVLKRGDDILFTSPVGETISSTINHLVHHRGQLTVYLRLNDRPVPSIYGPSADVGGFGNL
jgi:uncharacterized damage-inducible protein DinB